MTSWPDCISYGLVLLKHVYFLMCLLRLSCRVNPQPQCWHFTDLEPLAPGEWCTSTWRSISRRSPKRKTQVSLMHRTGFQCVLMCRLNNGQLDDHWLMSLPIDLPQATPVVKHKLWLTSAYRTMKNPVASRHDVIDRRFFCMYGFELLRRYVWRFCSVSAYIFFIDMSPHMREFLSLAACNVHHAR